MLGSALDVKVWSHAHVVCDGCCMVYGVKRKILEVFRIDFFIYIHDTLVRSST